MKNNHILPLSFVFDGAPLSQTFLVTLDISVICTVDDMRDIIHDIMSRNPHYNNILGVIDVKKLSLWYAVISDDQFRTGVDHLGNQVVHMDALVNKRMLRLEEKLDDAFGEGFYNPPDGHMIVVAKYED
ncbi:hypothetical protein BGZ95_009906 [Linnemannia exigua]|uniref:Uncharacterized protein n=1 Tax=Linnemannia exigua TaxID=604196 RepID=A0AAD4H6D9_9FUNG|nr:hypothetical protein BGZ95_009906 [Linnemannia exigua]